MADTEVETKFCNNCKKQISANNFMMHEVHCKRHIALCEHCKEPIPKGEMEVHYEENHAKIPCPKCGEEVEKMHLEDHEDNSCKKKPMDCVYCELKFPKNEFDAHIDYCGSRTEPCHKCGQYIKLRDQTKHEESKCRFPEVKPTNTDRQEPNNGYINGQGNEYLAGLPGLNPFALDELSRVLGPSGNTRSQANSNNASAAARKEIGAGAQDKRRARQNVTMKKASKTNQKSDLNRQRGQGGRGLSPSENDYDHMLAMHLAKDLNPDEDLDALMKTFQKPKAGQSPTVPEHRFMQNRNRFSEDMVMIPCEFCGEPFNADELVQHQSGCSLDRISDVLPTLISSNNRTDGINNVGGRGGDRSPTVDPPAIIDNLRNFTAEPWLDDTAMYPNNTDDEMMLPCEFCDELFPMDSLVQHQAMCDANQTVTPRVMTPADPPIRRPKPKKRAPLSHAIESDFPNLASRRHQPPPALSSNNFDRDDSDEDGGNIRPNKYSIGATHRIRKPNSSSVSNSNTSNSPRSPNEKIRSTMKKYGVDPIDRGDYYTRQGSNSRQSANSDSDSWLQPNAQVHKYRQSQGSSRTKSTLDNLLSDTDQSAASSHDLLGHIGASRKPQVNPAARKVAGAASRAPVKTRATAKDVQRELGRGGTSNTSTSSSQNRSSLPNFEVRVRPAEADELSPVVTSQRRTRANHVFGASSSTSKPTRTTKR